MMRAHLTLFILLVVAGSAAARQAVLQASAGELAVPFTQCDKQLPAPSAWRQRFSRPAAPLAPAIAAVAAALPPNGVTTMGHADAVRRAITKHNQNQAPEFRELLQCVQQFEAGERTRFSANPSAWIQSNPFFCLYGGFCIASQRGGPSDLWSYSKMQSRDGYSAPQPCAGNACIDRKKFVGQLHLATPVNMKALVMVLGEPNPQSDPFNFMTKYKAAGWQLRLASDNVPNGVPVSFLPFEHDQCVYHLIDNTKRLWSTSGLSGCSVYLAENPTNGRWLAIHANNNENEKDPATNTRCKDRCAAQILALPAHRGFVPKYRLAKDTYGMADPVSIQAYGVKDQNSRWTFSWLRVGDSGVKRGTNPLPAWTIAETVRPTGTAAQQDQRLAGLQGRAPAVGAQRRPQQPAQQQAPAANAAGRPRSRSV